MTEVLPAPAFAEGTSYYTSPRLRRSSSSQSAFLVGSSGSYPAKGSIKVQNISTDYVERATHSAPSSAPSSPCISQHDLPYSPSFSSSTPASSLSLNTKDIEEDEDEDEDQITFPSYDDVGYLQQESEDLEAPASPRTGVSSTFTPSSHDSSTPVLSFSRPETPEPTAIAEDDTAVRVAPSRHVDYLSHDWKEEDIWSSWRHIVSKRRIYSNSARLENASWRTWTKAKYKLRTVSPETLNWLKDCDVTWLYGPLQTDPTRGLMPFDTLAECRLSKSNSFLVKKPILKKRSMSEIMLQRSISASSLIRQAAAAVQAQQGHGSDRMSSRVQRANSDFISSAVASHSESDRSTSALPSASSSGIQTPSMGGDKRRIHFNDKVEQCIAVEVIGGPDDQEGEEEHYNAIDDDDSSDDGLVMMKRSTSSTKFRLSNRSTPRHSFSNESRTTIAMLPSTTLKVRDEVQDPVSALGALGRTWKSKMLSPSPSQETLRPSKPSANFLLDDEDDDDGDEDMSWEPSGTFGGIRHDGVIATYTHPSEITSDDETAEERAGMRRTPSGMFMPYEEDEDDVVAAGLFGRVVDSVNTAKDIAHVIWNVGWRR